MIVWLALIIFSDIGYGIGVKAAQIVDRYVRCKRDLPLKAPIQRLIIAIYIKNNRYLLIYIDQRGIPQRNMIFPNNL